MPRKYEANWYQSPLDLRPRRLGTAAIRHRIIPAGETVNIVGMRQAVLRGIRPVSGCTAEPLRIHELYEVQGKRTSLWMTDLPEELNQIKELMHVVNPDGAARVGEAVWRGRRSCVHGAAGPRLIIPGALHVCAPPIPSSPLLAHAS